MPSAFAQAVSQSRSVDVYQDGSNTSHAYIRLLYSLPAVVGEDGITYRPVDMGAGVAWANKNVGDADSTQVGPYFFWGGTNAITTSSNTAYYASVNDICERGQQMTVTAYPTNSATTTVAEWTNPDDGVIFSTDPTCTFDMVNDITCKVTFTTAYDTPCQLTTAVTPDESGEVCGEGVYEKGQTVRLFATAYPYYRFAYWADQTDNTNPQRYVTLTDDVTYTAVFLPDDKQALPVSINQNATADTTKILYDLPTSIVNNIFYTPVDMGYGTAWADRNIGAAAIDADGSYFWWGAAGAKTAFQVKNDASYFYSSVNTVGEENNLPVAADAAYRVLGSTWRMPTKEQFQTLVDKCMTDANTFVNPLYPTRQITLPEAGVYAPTTNANAPITTGHAGYWTSTLAHYNSTKYYSQAYCYFNGEVTYGDGIPTDSRYGYICFGMPVRAVYQPPFEVCTLTVNYLINDEVAHTNTYMCEPGQLLTLTAYPADGYSLAHWSDGNGEQIRTFTIEESMTLTATFAQSEVVLRDKQADEYYDQMAQTYYGDGSNSVSLTSITYDRTFQANQWTAFSLPFSYYTENTPLDGIVYEYTGATGNYMDGLYINFIITNHIQAGVPYLIHPDEMITSLVFTTSEDNPVLHFTDAISNEDGDALASYKDGLTVRFNATNRRYFLPGSSDPDWKNRIFLQNNRLYSHNQGNTMPAFRGFFTVDAADGVTPRIKIVTNSGETILMPLQELQGDSDTDGDKIRKFVENGILIIEIEGTRFNAQGQKVK